MKPLLQKTVASLRQLRRDSGVSAARRSGEKVVKTISDWVLQIREIPWWRFPVAHYLKYLSMGIMGLSVVILILGLIFMPRYNPEEYISGSKSGISAGGEGDAAEGASALTLVDAVKKYSEQFAASSSSKPIAKTPNGKPADVSPPPPPPPPPPPQVLPPKFRLEGTVMIGQSIGIAWIVPEGKTEAEAYFPGEVIEKYTLKRVESGQAHFEREGHDYTLKVPEVKKPVLTAGAAAPSPADAAKGKGDPRVQNPPPPRPPGVPDRPARRVREPHLQP